MIIKGNHTGCLVKVSFESKIRQSVLNLMKKESKTKLGLKIRRQTTEAEISIQSIIIMRMM